MLRRLFSRFVSLACIALFSASCISRPPVSYRQIDKKSLAYQEAHRLEAEKLLAQGKSSREAEKLAERHVIRQFTAAEKTRRLEHAKPLIEAWRAYEQPRGCWAYTVTTEKRRQDKTTITIERFNPFEPEERIWTLLSRDGVIPDENAQQSYRREKLKAWRKQLKKSAERKPQSKMIEWSVLADEFASVPSSVTDDVIFTVTNRPVKIRGMLDMPSSIETYTIHAAQLTRFTSRQLGTATMTLPPVVMHIDESEKSFEYGIIDPALPPFLLRVTTSFKLRLYGKPESGDVQTTYSDYQRVKCYDDRFEVNVGPPGRARLFAHVTVMRVSN